MGNPEKAGTQYKIGKKQVEKNVKAATKYEYFVRESGPLYESEGHTPTLRQTKREKQTGAPPPPSAPEHRVRRNHHHVSSAQDGILPQQHGGYLGG